MSKIRVYFIKPYTDYLTDMNLQREIKMKNNYYFNKFKMKK